MPEWSPPLSYTELHLHTHCSFLDGASAPEDLVARAAELGMGALAVTDHQGLYGAVRFRQACLEQGVRPIYGAEITLGGDDFSPAALHYGRRTGRDAGRDTGHDGRRSRVATATASTHPATVGAGHLTLLVETAAGWANLCRLLSAAALEPEATKHARPVSWDLLARHAEGLICLTGCREGVLGRPARNGDREGTLEVAKRLKALFGAERCYVELQRHFDAGDRRRGATLVGLARHLDLPIVATNNVHFARPEAHRLQQVLSCIRTRTSLDEAAAQGLLYATPHRYLKSGAEMEALFCDLPAAVANTARVAERCEFVLDLSHARLPPFPVPAGETPFSHLYKLCGAGLAERYRPVTPEASTQLAHELGVIERCGLASYFLLVHDLVAFARQKGILAQGRGSAAGSVVAYVLGITPVDPLAHGLLFERFLSEDSTSTPDIDIDFAADRREEVIQYVYERYGAQHTAMVANVVTFRARSAVADVGKALGFPADVLGRVADVVHARAASDVALDLGEVTEFADRLEHLPWRQLVDLCAQIDGFPRHLSIHVGGMIVTGEPLTNLVPLERATMPGRVVVQWDKDDVADAGLIKIDLLSLRTLGLVAECFTAIAAAGGPALDLVSVPADDPAVWQMLAAADTIGVFQVESRAQIALLPRLRPTTMHDLTVEIALIRPGPIKGGMTRAYLARRDGEAAIEYLHDSLKPVLAETLGTLVFQEQVLRVAMVLAGFSGGQADNLRRAMSRKRSREAMERLREAFIMGVLAGGHSADMGHTLFDQLKGFASYGFCKSHAAAFAQLTYVTAWLKRHHPLPFTAALLNQQPMGFYSVETVVEDAKRQGLTILPLCVNHSGVRWVGERHEGRDALRVPLTRLNGLPTALAERIVAERAAGGAFPDLWSFVQRVRPARLYIERLIQAGALDVMGDDRRQLLWALGEMEWESEALGGPSPSLLGSPTDRRSDGAAAPLPILGEGRKKGGELVAASPRSSRLALAPVVTPADLPPTTVADAVAADYGLLGLAQETHLVALYRPRLAEIGAITSRALEVQPHGTKVRIGGRIEVIQRPPTAKGVAFISLEDEFGLVNLILFPDVYERYRFVFRHAPILIAEGVVQREKGALHVIVDAVAVLAGEEGAEGSVKQAAG